MIIRTFETKIMPVGEPFGVNSHSGIRKSDSSARSTQIGISRVEVLHSHSRYFRAAIRLGSILWQSSIRAPSEKVLIAS